MMVRCQLSDTKTSLSSTTVTGRSRNMSGGSTGSLGSLEAEVPTTNPLSLSWGSDVISTFRNGFASAARTSPNNSVGGDSSSCDSNNSGQKNIVNPTRYKTEMCRPFNETGYCKYGEKCQFAHGGHELRAMPRHPKYKTELCRTFHTVGFCPYGPRCHFVHNEDDSKLSEINTMKQQYAQQQAVQEIATQAARFQALINQASVDSQFKALLNQSHSSIIPRTALMSHVHGTAGAGIVQQHQQQAAASSEQFNHWMSVPPPSFNRSDTMGSTGETPPSSTSTSPVTSPNLPWGCDAATMAQSTHHGTASRSAFPFESIVMRSPAVLTNDIESAVIGTSLQRHHFTAAGCSEMSQLAASLERVTLQPQVQVQPAADTAIFSDIAAVSDTTTPPSSPESGSNSNASTLARSNRAMRLPVFSKFASLV